MTDCDQLLFRLGPQEGQPLELLAAATQPSGMARRWQDLLEPWLSVGLPGARAALPRPPRPARPLPARPETCLARFPVPRGRGRAVRAVRGDRRDAAAGAACRSAG